MPDFSELKRINAAVKCYATIYYKNHNGIGWRTKDESTFYAGVKRVFSIGTEAETSVEFNLSRNFLIEEIKPKSLSCDFNYIKYEE
jgi:hypothetical protein